MSTARTGAAQLARLFDLGLRVKLLPPLRDIDTAEDAARVAEDHPQLIFSRQYRQLLGAATAPMGSGRGAASEADARTVFDRAYTGDVLRSTSLSGIDPLRVDDRLWRQPADEVDQLVVARCSAPVIDIGCGPGRMVAALAESGQSALGVDLSGAAVEASRRRGGPALRRDVTGPLPGEGRWGTVLLMDSNIGLGGDVDALLRRATTLAAPGGLIICETDDDPTVDEVHSVQLSSGGLVTSVRWARIGADSLIRRARELDLVPAERWSTNGRTFVTLGRR